MPDVSLLNELAAWLGAIAGVAATLALSAPWIIRDQGSRPVLGSLFARLKSPRSSQKHEVILQRRKTQAILQSIRARRALENAADQSSLREQLNQSGLRIGIATFYWFAGVVFSGVTIWTHFFFPELPLLLDLLIASALAIFVPRTILKAAIKRHQTRFRQEFIVALDTITRGLRSGLPLAGALQVAANECKEPVRGEFKDALDRYRFGAQLSECFNGTAKRVPLAEIRFFVVVLSINQQAGGGLADALDNLGSVLRDRQTLAAKVQALSADSRISATIIGGLPIFMGSLVYFFSPEYLRPFWDTPTGNAVLIASGAWLLIGIIALRRMTRVEL